MKSIRKIKIIQTILFFCLISINFNIHSFAVKDAGGVVATINVDGDEYPYRITTSGSKRPIESEMTKDQVKSIPKTSADLFILRNSNNFQK